MLCLVDVLGIPTLLWKLLEEIRPGDRVVLQRTPRRGDRHLTAGVSARRQSSLGAFVSEGWSSPRSRAGFNNIDEEFFACVLAAYDLRSAGRATCHRGTIASGSTLHELDVQDMSALRNSVLAD